MAQEVAQAIVAYRDKDTIPGTLMDYNDFGSGKTGRYDTIRDVIDAGFEPNDIREEVGFESIGELNFVLNDRNDKYRIDYHARVANDLKWYPDLTTYDVGVGDDIIDDFDERDVIFSRISNITTVRSDVFTAYVLVRIGTNGPQKRVVAVLDRSNAYTGAGIVNVYVWHPVSDPR